MKEPDDEGPIQAPQDDECGPAMRACTQSERMFIVALVECGAKSATQAAMMLGTFSNRASAKVSGSRWRNTERVQLALKEWTQKALEGDVYLARTALREIVADTMHKDRFRAVQELFNRNGMLVETVSRHIIEDKRDTRDIVIAAIAYARQLGDPQLAYKLLGNSVPKDVIDAEFEVVAPEKVLVTIGSEGLEDIL